VAELAKELVSRDPLGRRPLVYASLNGGAIWAEHEHEVIARLPAMPAPDPLALKSWLEYGVLPPGRTLYEGIHRLAPGCRLVEVDGSIGTERYWQPRFAGTISGERGEVAELLRTEAFAAVGRAAADPGITAVRLSGGLDSAAVAAGLRARTSPAAPALALSLVFPDHPETDERELIDATGAHLGLAVEQIPFTPGSELLPAVRRHIERWLLPPASPNLFLWEPLMARARELGVARMLDGEGGDELFGTAPELIGEMLRRGHLARAWELCGRIPGVGTEPSRSLRLRAMRRFGLVPLLPAGIRTRRRLRRARGEDAGSLLSEADRVEQAQLEPDLEPLEGPLWWRGLAATLSDVDALDVAAQLRRDEVDGGVERRHPFLFDLELVETVLRLPPELGFDPIRDRPLLREALVGHVPEAVRRRTAKARFNPLLADALSGEEGRQMLAGLAEPGAAIRAYLSGAALDRLLAGVPTLAGASQMQLWRVGIADLWLRSLSAR
jgi:asparagine synthase (glutamine-hydrolysing)